MGEKKKPSNAILQDVDKNAEKNEEDIDNRNKHVIKPISEAESSAWDEPTLWQWVDISENLWTKQNKKTEKW